MANPQSTIQRTFSGGELAPALHARADLAKYQTGLRRCRNFVVQRHGGVTNRAGTRHIAACKTDVVGVMLMRYVSENIGESLLLEVGNGYIRFYKNGAQLNVVLGDVAAYNGATNYVIGDLVQSGAVVYYARVANVGIAPPAAATWYAFTGTVYELPNPFGALLPHWNQSGRTITLTLKGSAPGDLINGGALTSWILRPVNTGLTYPAPTGLGVAAGGGAGTQSIGYVVTAASPATYEESLPSGQVINVGVGPPTPAAPDVLTWLAPVGGAVEYYIYCDPFGNGTYGYVGTATGALTFKATGVVPDFALTPPVVQVLFAATNDYPDRSAVYQQRRLFANTINVPDGVWGSRVGFNSNFTISSPLQDDDAITFRLAGNNNNPVKHLLGLKGLIALTDAGAWTVDGGQATLPLKPNGINADQKTYTGIGDPRPVLIGNACLYVQARGSTLFDLRFDQQVEGLGGRDLSLFADHLFAGFKITELDYAQTPDSIVWACRDDGALLGLTYISEHDVSGWHRHDSAAACSFEHVCVVPEADGDTVYFITRRTLGGVSKRSIERLAKRLVVTFDPDAFFVDAGLTYAGAPVSNIAGLTHLNGQVVAVVGDGAVVFNGDPLAINAADFTVAAGTLPKALPAAYSTIHAGLRITAELETLDLDVQGSAIRADKKRVGSLNVLLEKSSRTFRAGPDSANLTDLRLEVYDVALDEFTGNVEIDLIDGYDDYGRVFIQHTEPLPLTILAVLPNVTVGG